MGESAEKDLKVFMLPWLAHGHISPFLELAKKLSKRNILIYLCSTPINIELSITKKLVLPPYSKSIKVVQLNLPTLPNLPPDYHTTNGLPPHLMGTLKQAFESSKDDLSKILIDLKPDFFIHDFSIGWGNEVALSAGIPSIVFSTFSAVSVTYFLHMVTQPGQVFPFPSIYLHEYEYEKLIASSDADAIKKDDSDQLNSNANKTSHSNPTSLSQLRLIKTSKEIEGRYIDYITEITKEQVMAVGLLAGDEEPQRDDDSVGLVEWLNKKEKRSCILVSFGSEYFPKEDEIEEIAYGLEISNINFIWALKFSKDKERVVKMEDILPQGFVERVRERGRIIQGWFPQSRILSHQSIGGFMTHCGWSSVLESMTNGVPMIGFPMQLDQPLNARLMVEIGVGLEVSREEKSGAVKREEVARAVRMVLIEKQGEVIRRRAFELHQELESKGEEEIDDLVKQLVLINQNKKGDFSFLKDKNQM